MTTYTQRIQVTTPSEVREALASYALRDGVTLSAKAAEYLELGLALSEDIALGEFVEERLRTPRTEYLSHADVWKE